MSSEINKLWRFKEFSLDVRSTTIWFNNELVDIPVKSVEVLKILVSRQGDVVTREELIEIVWGDAFVEDGVLTQCVYTLRKLFRDNGVEEELIQTVPRRGYLFLGDVSEEIGELTLESTITEDSIVLESGIASESAKRRSSYWLSTIGVVLIATSIGAGIWFLNPSNGASRERPRPIKFLALTEAGNESEPAISKDGKTLAYVVSKNNTNQIFLKNIVTGSSIGIGEPKPFEVRSLNFSPDGSFVYYITREPDNADSTVYRAPVFGGNERLISKGLRHFVSLSPSGTQLAFIRYDNVEDRFDLVVTSELGEEERVVTSRTPPEFFHDWDRYPAWSPDESTIVMPVHVQSRNGRSRESYFARIGVDTGSIARIPHPSWHMVGNAKWNPRGDSLIVSAREKVDSLFQLWELDIESGDTRRITNDTNDYSDFRLSADGASIVVSSVKSSTDLYEYTPKSGELVRLTHQNLGNNGLWGVDYSPDGNEVVYVKNKGRTDGNLWHLTKESKKERQLTFFETASILKPRFAPNGDIYFASNHRGQWHIWKTDSEGKTSTQVTFGDEGQNYPEVTDDGKYLFFSSPGRNSEKLWRKQLPDGKPEIVAENTGNVVAVSPKDANQVARFMYDQGANYPWTIGVIDLGSSTIQNLRIEPENHSFIWDKDGKGIFFGKKSLNVTNLWFKPIDGAPRQVSNFEDKKIVELALSPNGESVILVREEKRSNILLIELPQ